MDAASALLLWSLIVLISNAVLSIPVAYVAAQKGRSGVGFFFLSFFLSFIVGILVAIAIPRREVPVDASTSSRFVRSNEGELVKCPFCAEWVKAEAKVCKYCGKDIADEVAALRAEERTKQASAAAEREAAIAAYRALEAENATKEAARRAAFRKSYKFKLLVAGISAAALGIAGIAFFLSIQPKPQKPLVKSEFERVNEWLVVMDSCGFDVRNAATTVNQEENSYSGETAESIKYSPAEGAQHKLWSFKYASWESMSELEIEMLISHKLDENLVSCLADQYFAVETLDLEEAWLESEDSEIFVNSNKKEIYVQEVQFLDW